MSHPSTSSLLPALHEDLRTDLQEILGVATRRELIAMIVAASTPAEQLGAIELRADLV